MFIRIRDLARVRTRVCVFPLERSFLLVAVPVSRRAAPLKVVPSSTLSNTFVRGTEESLPLLPGV